MKGSSIIFLGVLMLSISAMFIPHQSFFPATPEQQAIDGRILIIAALGYICRAIEDRH